jgi:energy-coupling factor transporter ATP-binding protein EcfA2
VKKSTASGEIAVEFQDVSFRYPGSGAQALADLSFAVRRGEMVAVIGMNGAGKSSLCKCVDGIIPHSEGGTFNGRVIAAGMDTRDHPVAALARRVGLVLEDPDAQLFATTVLDEAAFGPENLEMDVAEILSSVAGALEAVGLVGLEGRAPSTLSGGQKQRLALAGALAMKPEILVLDEPTSRLDAEGAENFMRVLGAMKRTMGLTVIMTTHDRELAAKHADRILALSGGGVSAFDLPARVFAREMEEYSRRVVPKPRNTESAGAGEKVSTGPRGGPDSKPVLEVEGLSFSYPGGITALRDVSLTVRAGEFVGIVGRNGSGKTSLLKCVLGLVEPSSGRTSVGGGITRDLSPGELAFRVGYVQQNPDLQLFADTVRREVSFGPVNLGFSPGETERRVMAALDAVGLAEKADEHPLGLGRGDRSLTALASVLAMEPALLLLDEPTQGQDLRGCIRVMDLVRRLGNDGRAVIVVGHDLGLLAEYADRIVVLDGGAIIEDGSPEEILSRPDLLVQAGLRLPKFYTPPREERPGPSLKQETI